MEMARSPLCRKTDSLCWFYRWKSKTVLCLAGQSALPIVLSVCLTGCHSQQSRNQPAIEFSKIPPAAQGGRERVDTIAGSVKGARPGQQIVIYAKSGPWWVQPWPDKPFIPIRSDATWNTTTHLGYEYAALLVDATYQPPPTVDAAPTQGGSVIAVSIVKGVGTLPPNPTKPLHFSGYDWRVRTVSADAGGVNRPYDADNAWTDPSGALHMRIGKKSGNWTCAQVVLERSLGYGTYVVVTRDAALLEPAVVLTMETFDESAGDHNYREMGVEISRWGDATAQANAQYDVQPFYISGNVVPFKAPSGTLTNSLRWEPGRASFETVRGASSHKGSADVSQHVFMSGIPSPGNELFQLTLYVVPNAKNPLQKETEVVVEKFQYLP
jgi:hypothetical protein